MTAEPLLCSRPRLGTVGGQLTAWLWAARRSFRLRRLTLQSLTAEQEPAHAPTSVPTKPATSTPETIVLGYCCRCMLCLDLFEAPSWLGEGTLPLERDEKRQVEKQPDRPTMLAHVSSQAPVAPSWFLFLSQGLKPAEELQRPIDGSVLFSPLMVSSLDVDESGSRPKAG